MRFLISFGLLALLSMPSTAHYSGSGSPYLKFELEKVSIVSIEFHGMGTPLRSKVLRVSGLPSQLRADMPSRGRLSARRKGPLRATLTGKRQHRPVKVLKPVDKASPLLSRAMKERSVLSRVVLRGRHRETGQAVILVLVSPRITVQRQQNQSSTGTFQTEMLSMDLRG